MIQIGINGFGRIGRVILRACLQNSDLDITAINDPAIDVEYICYLIKFDSTHGKFNGTIEFVKDEIFVDDHRIKVFHEKQPSHIPWQTAGVQYVVEASGMFTTLEKASGHLASETVKRVIVTAPSVDIPMIIIGVNDKKFNSGQKVISCASSTLYCLAPIIKILEDNFGLTEGFVTSIHAMTPSLKPLDGLCLRGKHWRDHRSIHQNIIPAASGACRALGKIIPRAKDKLAGLAFRVPIVNVSLLDFTIRLSSNTTMEKLIEKVDQASQSTMKNVIKISNEDAVSSDFIGETHSCVLDADSSIQLKSNFFKLVCWYENEYSYACRVIDSIYLSENKVEVTPSSPQSLKKQESVQQSTCSQKTVLSSASQETELKFKHPSRVMLLKKPSCSHLQGTQFTVNNNYANKNNVYKIWSEEKELPNSAVRENRNSFFHSCVAISPQNTEESDCVKAKKRLQVLKFEFSKLVNITENLLKKSYGNNTHNNSGDKLLEHENKNDIPNSKEGKEKNLTCNHSAIETKSLQGNVMPSDKKSLCEQERLREFIPTYISNTAGNAITDFSKSTIHHADNTAYKASEDLLWNENKHMDSSSSVARPKILNADQTEHVRISNENKQSEIQIKLSDPLESSEVKKTSNNLIKKLQLQCLRVDKNNFYKDDKASIEKNSVFDSDADINVRSHIEVPCAAKSQSINEENGNNVINNTIEVSATEMGDAKINPMNTEEEINRIQQETEDNNENVIDHDQNICENTSKTSNTKSDKSPSVSLTSYDDGDSKSLLTVNRISPERISLQSERTSKYGSPDNNSLFSNLEVYKHKQDIYDKLDSVSGTDSNNSFQIDERRSQVINLSDLTSSLEDLARLDKICKIIEISDELSNKLFAALDNTEIENMEKKKWSFRDLCEKIKLDEFCDSLFGKSK